MPRLTVYGIAPEQLCRISAALVEELAVLCECSTDNFTIEQVHTTSIFAGQVVASYPFVEVAWFDRGTETRDRFAVILAMHIQSLGIPEVETAFVTYREDSYYLNGQPLWK